MQGDHGGGVMLDTQPLAETVRVIQSGPAMPIPKTMPPASDARLEPGGRRPSKQGGRRPSKLLSLFSFSFAKRRKHSTAEADAATLSKALGGSEREGMQLKNGSGSSGGSARPLHPAEEP